MHVLYFHNIEQMKLFFTVIFFILSFFLTGQTITFEYLFSSPKNELLIDLYESDNGDIFFSGYISNHRDYSIQRNGLLGKIDRFGQFIDTVVTNYSEKCFAYTTLLPINDSVILLDGIKTDTLGQFENASIVLSKMNKDFGLIEKKEYDFPPGYRVHFHLAYTGNFNTFLVAGTYQKIPDPIKSFVYRIDENMDSLKAKFFLDHTFFYSKLSEMYDGRLWVLTALNSKYVIIDSTWSEVTEYNMPVYINAEYGLKWDTDTSFFLAGDYVSLPPNESNDDIAVIRQFHPTDTTGYLFRQWGTQDTIDHPAAWGALDYKNKDSIYIGGTTNIGPTYYGYCPSWYFVIQTDSLLNIRWERFYGGDAYYLMQKIIATNDGGCLIAGTRYDYENATEEELDIHILKLNSEGLLVREQNHNTIQVKEALVFPNPGTDHLKVRVAAQYPESIFELYNINGKQVLNRKIHGKWGNINTSLLKSGTYIYRILNNKGLIETGKWVKQ